MSSVQEHNEMVLAGLEKGDAVEFKRGIYSHWALYIGNGQVIHLTGDSSAASNCFSGVPASGLGRGKAWVRKDRFVDVAKGSKASKNNNNDRNFGVRPVDEIIATATSMLGEIDYSTLRNNCEHFVNLCRYGRRNSQQAARAWGILGSVATGITAAIGIIVTIFIRRY